MRELKEAASRALGTIVGSSLLLCPAFARADDAAPSSGRESTAPPPAARRAYLQYGVAFTVESVASPGPICSDPSPCILGSGGGVAIRVGWRPTETWYFGGAYELSKQDPAKLYRLAILQQARAEMRHYFPTGYAITPFALLGIGMVGYGNEWSVDTWGPGATLGGGVEVRLSERSVLGVSLAYRPIYLRSFVDSIAQLHSAGFAHFVGLELALEVQDAL